MKHLNLEDVEWQDRFDHQKALVFDQDDLQTPGAKFQLIKLPSGISIKSHHHQVRTEVFVVLTGAGTITMNHQPIPAIGGEIILCQVGDTHAFANTGTEDLVIAVFRTNDPGDSDLIWEEGEGK